MPAPASSGPDQETMKLVLVVVAGSGLTVLVGAVGSMVTRACLVGSMPLAGVLVVHLVGGDGSAEVEGDVGDVADLRAGGQAGFGLDGEADEADAAAACRPRAAGSRSRMLAGGRSVLGSIDWNEAVRSPVAGFRFRSMSTSKVSPFSVTVTVVS